MKKKWGAMLLCVLLAGTCVPPVSAQEGTGLQAAWQGYTIEAQWVVDDTTPSGDMQEAAGKKIVEVRLAALGDGVLAEDIPEYAGNIGLFYQIVDTAVPPSIYTLYDLAYDEAQGAYVPLERQSDFSLRYQVPEDWMPEGYGLYVHDGEGNTTNLALVSIVQVAPEVRPDEEPGEELMTGGGDSDLYRLTLRPSAALDLHDLEADQARVADQVTAYLDTAEIQVDFALVAGAPYLGLRFFAGEQDLGGAEAYLKGDLLYVRGDMLPAGWVTVKPSEVIASMAGASEDELPTAALDPITTLGQVFAALGESIDDWTAAQPEGEGMTREIREIMQDWPVFYTYHLQAGQRTEISAEAIEEILIGTEKNLRAMAEEGALVDFDGGLLADEEAYEGSMVYKLYSSIYEWNRQRGMSLTMDNLRGSGGFEERTLSMRSKRFEEMYLYSIRRYGWGSGEAQTYSGELFMASQRLGRTEAHLDMRFLPEAGWYDIDLTGVAMGYRGSYAGFDGGLSVRLPPVDAGESTIFDSTLNLLLTGRANEIQVYATAGAVHNTEESARRAWDDCTLALDVRLEAGSLRYPEMGSDIIQAGLDIHYQQLDEVPELLPLEEVRAHISPESDEAELEAYVREAEATLTSWGIKVMATLPSALLQEVMSGSGFSW